MKKLHLIILILALPVICIAQKWELKKNEDGIAVYTAKLQDEKFKEIKVICEFKGTIAQLIKIMQNVDHNKDWIYNNKVSYLINRKNRDTLTYYSEVSLPWPVSNRDLVMQQCFIRDTVNKALRIEVKTVTNVMPPKPKLVRVPYSLGLWTVKTMPNNKIRIEYIFSVDPGGSLPAWVVNFLATAGPFNTFKNLKALIETKK
ncbi:START domain-containing protein [Mucilaginibacter sp.]|uniref:START domain-containing protein n=1 Tax=Mucilaginibacter sp. TaxID=1882438 RepID=UPI003D10A1CC